MTNILIYAAVCAVAFLIITGGILSMATGEAPGTVSLFGGSLLGAAVGAAYPLLTETSSVRSITKMIGGGDTQTMKVGLPAF